MITSPKTLATLQAEEEQRRKAAEQLLGAAAEPTYVIASGAIKPTTGLFAVDTEGAASSDDLDRLTGEPDVTLAGFPGHGVVLLRAAHTDRTVVVRHEQGGSYDISLAFGSTFALDSDRKGLALQLRGTRWYEIDRDYGEDHAARRSALGLTKVAQLANPANPGDTGKYVGAVSGEPAWLLLPFGGDGFLSRSLSNPGSGRVYASGSPVRFEDVQIGAPNTDSYQFFAPAGATRCRVEVMAQLEKQNENAQHDFATLKVALSYFYNTKSGAYVYDETGGFGARGLPARSVFFRPQSESDRLVDPHVAIASSVLPLLPGGRSIRVQVHGLSANSYRVRGTKTRAWLSIQWM